MAYVRSKKIKGHKYYYLVEGRREGGKVKQRVLAYLGASEPSATAVQHAKAKHAKPKTTAPVVSPKAEPPQNSSERTRQAVYEAFGLRVRHNIGVKAGVGGRVLIKSGKPYAVSLMKSPDTNTLLHELGHVIDFNLRDRATVDRASDERFEHIFDSDLTSQILQREGANLAYQQYPRSHKQLVDLSEKLHREGMLLGWERKKLTTLKKFFTEYAETGDEGFANAFALYVEHPEHAEQIAPKHCELIFALVDDHPDIREVVDGLMHSPLL